MDPEGRPRVSDSGNLLGDGHFDLISDPEGLARRLDAVPGLVGHGLFLGMADLVLVGDETGGVREVATGRTQ
jgi:ribose 5-phosphate isomerase A